jgi:hypothetical protein
MTILIMFVCKFNANIGYFFLHLCLSTLFCLLFNTFFRIMYCVRAKYLLILQQNPTKHKYNLKISVIKKYEKNIIDGCCNLCSICNDLM